MIIFLLFCLVALGIHATRHLSADEIIAKAKSYVKKREEKTTIAKRVILSIKEDLKPSETPTFDTIYKGIINGDFDPGTTIEVGAEIMRKLESEYLKQKPMVFQKDLYKDPHDFSFCEGYKLRVNLPTHRTLVYWVIGEKQE